MKTLYLECNMGAAGDMLMAALSELIEDKEAFIKVMNGLQIAGVTVEAKQAVKCGITGTHMEVLVKGVEEVSEDVGHEHHHEHEHEHHHEHHHDHEHEHHHEHDHDHEHEHHHEHHHDHEHEHHHEHHHDHEHEHHHEHHDHSHGHHHHASMQDIRNIVDALEIPQKVKDDVLAVYQIIAQAESQVHGRTIEEIHFHEVGTMDAVADIVGVCYLMNQIAPEKIVVSPIHVGCGEVRCAHGVLPVPAPATALILQGIPIYGGEIKGELCTPTGAALLKYFATEFDYMPIMVVEKIGYGMGKKEFPRANCIRAMLGTSDEKKTEVYELCCNLDDMTPEAIGFVTELLMEKGALDVYTTAVGMKKNRPGILLTCMCAETKREEMLRLMFANTTTLGIREKVCNRYTMNRRQSVCSTPYGDIRIKESEGYGVLRKKPEYEDMAKIARNKGMSLAQVAELLE